MTENKRFVAIGVEWTDGFIQDHVSDRDLFSVGAVCNLLNELSEENEQLKKELVEFKKWEKHIGNVKREELDRIFKMSIYEIAEAFDYYNERIEKLEKRLLE